MAEEQTVLNEQTPEQIAEQLANQVVQQQEPVQLQREYVVETNTGQVFRGKTQQEVIDKLKNSVEEGTKTIAQFNRERQQVVQQPVVQEAPKFDQNKYYEMWAQDPTAALNYQMQALYGVTLQDVVSQVKDASSFAQEVRPRTIISEWQSESDFPTSDPAELSKAGDAMQKAWNELLPAGTPVTKQNLELIHNYCLQKGMYRSEKSLHEQTVQPTQQPGYLPTLDATSGGTSSQSFNPNTMPLDQLRQALENMNQR